MRKLFKPWPEMNFVGNLHTSVRRAVSRDVGNYRRAELQIAQHPAGGEKGYPRLKCAGKQVRYMFSVLTLSTSVTRKV